MESVVGSLASFLPGLNAWVNRTQTGLPRIDFLNHGWRTGREWYWNSYEQNNMTAWQKARGALPLVPEIGIVTLVPHEWHGPWSTRQYLIDRLARYFPIAWVDPPRGWRESLARIVHATPGDSSLAADPSDAIMIHDPKWLPKLYRPRAVAELFDRLRLVGAAKRLRQRGCRRIVLYLWRPEFAPALDLMPHDFSCYHIDDEYTFSVTEKPIEAGEERLIRRAGQVIIHSPALLEKKGHLNPRTMFVPNGVDYSAYATPRPEPADMRDIPHPRVGYTGIIKAQMDFPLLIELARRHSDWSFVFVGPRGNITGQESSLAELVRLPNVHMMGGRPVTDLPAYVQHFDAGMLCYVVNDYTKYIYPLKMHEYLASGLPVVSSPIRTLQDFTHIVTLASSSDEWSRALAAALEPSALSRESVRARQEVARSFDWGRHAATIARTICERLGTGKAASIDFTETPGNDTPEKLIWTPPVVSFSRTQPDETVDSLRAKRVRYPLAVYTPQIGVLSETFIRRHVRDLLPGKTAVLAGMASANEGLHWKVDGPLLELDAIQRRIGRRFGLGLLRGMGFRVSDMPRKSIERFLKQHGVQVIMGEYLHTTLPWIDIARRLGIRCFGHAHGWDVSKLLRDPEWRAEYLRYNESGGIIAVSNASRARLVQLGIHESKIHVVPCGVEVPPQVKQRKPGELVRCVAVGRMVAKKAPILLLDAVRRAMEIVSGLRLDYVGDGDLLPAARQYVQAFNLADRVTLHGSQPQEVVQRLMDGADIFVQHSIIDPDTGDEEGLPVAILEAMAQSLPVVSTRHAGIPEAVLDGLTGFVVNEGDVRVMAERIAMLARDSALRQQLGGAGWERARARYTWQKERDDLRQVMGLE